MLALITRPREDAEPVAARLAERGVDSLIEPMLEIEHLGGVDVDLAHVQAILLTSANGARALAAATGERRLPVFAVGDATATTARALGFANVESAGGDVTDLARLVESKLDPKTGTLMHAAGSVLAGDLAERLDAAGFEIRRVVLYRAHKATALSADARAALEAGEAALALFFSPRTAATFVTLARDANVVAACGNVTAFCLSRAVAEAVDGLPWRDVRCAARPELSALLDEVDAALREGSLENGETPGAG